MIWMSVTLVGSSMKVSYYLFLKMAVTFASLHEAGTLPKYMDFLNKIVR